MTKDRIKSIAAILNSCDLEMSSKTLTGKYIPKFNTSDIGSTQCILNIMAYLGLISKISKPIPGKLTYRVTYKRNKKMIALNLEI